RGALGGARPGEGDDDPPAVARPGAHLLDGPGHVTGEALDRGRVEGDVLVVVLGLEREGPGRPPGQPADAGGGLHLGEVPEGRRTAGDERPPRLGPRRPPRGWVL